MMSVPSLYTLAEASKLLGGRGRRPLWLSKELDGGAKLEEMAA